MVLAKRAHAFRRLLFTDFRECSCRSSLLRPSWGIVLELLPPAFPSRAWAARKQLRIGSGGASLDNGIKLIRLSRVFPLFALEVIDLPATGIEGPGMLAAHPKQDKLRDIAEVEADTPVIGTAIVADFVPDEIGLVGEAPSLHDGKPLRQERVWHP